MTRTNSDRALLGAAVALTILMGACGPAGIPAARQPTALVPTSTATVEPPTPHLARVATPTPLAACDVVLVRAALGAEACPPPAVVPPTPAALPDGFYGLDRSTGLHVTGRAPAVDLGTYRLSVIGRVDSPLSLSYDEVRCMPKVKTTCALVCPGFFTDTATWQGVPLDYLLSLAGVQSGAESLVLVSADDYRTSIRLDTARAANGFLAYEWGDEPLPILHGFPVRAVFPGVEGNKWAKWLVRIEVH